jgi:dTDP-glucose 4,6-dehydratase
MVDVLVTGGAGFLGSHFVRRALLSHPDWRVTTLDAMGDAGRVENLREALDHPRHRFARGGVSDAALVSFLLSRSSIVVHFAGEVEEGGPGADGEAAARDDVYGTYVLLEAATRAGTLARFVHVSPGEVYGCRDAGAIAETAELRPEDPCAATKAGADRLAYSFFATYGVPVVIVRAACTYGPFQAATQLVPRLITRAIDGLPLPLPGEGRQVRDWLHVSDHCEALEAVIDRGRPGEVYNVGGDNEVADAELARAILARLGRPETLIQPGPRRPGGRRSCLDTARVRGLGWAPAMAFAAGLADTVAWYAGNQWWWRTAAEGTVAGA